MGKLPAASGTAVWPAVTVETFAVTERHAARRRAGVGDGRVHPVGRPRRGPSRRRCRRSSSAITIGVSVGARKSDAAVTLLPLFVVCALKAAKVEPDAGGRRSRPRASPSSAMAERAPHSSSACSDGRQIVISSSTSRAASARPKSSIGRLFVRARTSSAAELGDPVDDPADLAAGAHGPALRDVVGVAAGDEGDAPAADPHAAHAVRHEPVLVRRVAEGHDVARTGLERGDPLDDGHIAGAERRLHAAREHGERARVEERAAARVPARCRARSRPRRTRGSGAPCAPARARAAPCAGPGGGARRCSRPALRSARCAGRARRARGAPRSPPRRAGSRRAPAGSWSRRARAGSRAACAGRQAGRSRAGERRRAARAERRRPGRGRAARTRTCTRTAPTVMFVSVTVPRRSSPATRLVRRQQHRIGAGVELARRQHLHANARSERLVRGGHAHGEDEQRREGQAGHQTGGPRGALRRGGHRDSSVLPSLRGCAPPSAGCERRWSGPRRPARRRPTRSPCRRASRSGPSRRRCRGHRGGRCSSRSEARSACPL